MSYRKIKLKNGLRVILVPRTETSAVTLLALYEVGSRYESAALSGVSHFIEHLLFKGTKRRPTTLDISRDLDSVGADYNAFTSKDYTGYYIKLPSGRFDLAADMLEDMIYHSTFKSANIRSERQVILEELRMYEDNPLLLVEELVEEELYRGSPLGRRIGGTVDSVLQIKREDLLGYRNQYYNPARTVLAVSGQFDEQNVLERLEKTFGRVETKNRGRNFEKFNLTQAGYRRPRVKLVHRNTEQVQVALSFPAFSHLDSELPASKVMSVILGGTMSSRLFTTVREKEGLCYGISSQISPYQDVGNLTIQAGLSLDRIEQAIKLIFSEINRLVEGGVSADELHLAQEYIKGKTLLSLEDSSLLGNWYAKQELLTKRIETPTERLERISAVNRDDVRRVARQIFRRNRLSLAVIGPQERMTGLLSLTEELK